MAGFDSEGILSRGGSRVNSESSLLGQQLWAKEAAGGPVVMLNCGMKAMLRATRLSTDCQAQSYLDNFPLTVNFPGTTIFHGRTQTQRWNNLPGNPGEKVAEQGFEPRAVFQPQCSTV